jgi:hypothetical protein
MRPYIICHTLSFGDSPLSTSLMPQTSSIGIRTLLLEGGGHINGPCPHIKQVAEASLKRLKTPHRMLRRAGNSGLASVDR